MRLDRRTAHRVAERFGIPLRILVKELSAFGVVGLINLGVDVGLFNWLHFGEHVGVLLSKVCSTTVATTLSYFMNRHWSFSHRARTGLRREYALFFVLNLIALGLGTIVLAIGHHGMGIDGTVGLNLVNLVGIGLGTIFRFWSYKRWVFPSTDDLAPQPARMR
ncbi:MAG: GtrA family protein [Mycobacteriales bacterium]